jgi:glycosyltransferase involved in cell wall biosynthesis
MSKFFASVESASSLARIAFLGTFVPRQCGIATFSADLARAVQVSQPNLLVAAVAVNDQHGYQYPDTVSFDFNEAEEESYSEVADFLNRKRFDVLSLQHEFGIYGGESGSYVLRLMREVTMPVVTTLHTVLATPSKCQRRVMDELMMLSSRVVVMSQRGVDLLTSVYGVPADKIDLIPHGIPFIPPDTDGAIRRRLKVDGPLIFTFGLLSPDKGIQFVIEAMPKILREHPDAEYHVVGATHPHVRETAGECYRHSLIALAESLGVAKSVRFVDQFVPADELIDYLSAMDIYITPYLNPEQITSGTLAYSVGAGKAVISTPYSYAKEILADDRGVLVPFRSHQAISDAVLEIQSNPAWTAKMGKRAAEFGQHMRWPDVAQGYLSSFRQAIAGAPVPPTPVTAFILPDISLNHLNAICDDTGILQHATGVTPNRSEGYCVDDNARALILTVALERAGVPSYQWDALRGRFLSFILHSWNPETQRFRNFMSYDRRWLESSGSEDSQGRTLWALGVLIGHARHPQRIQVARGLFKNAMPGLLETTSLRTWAYCALAGDEYLRAYPTDTDVNEFVRTMGNRLMFQYRAEAVVDWPWFEKTLTYSNARLAQALLVAGDLAGDADMKSTGIQAFRWLTEQQTDPAGRFLPIGSNGFATFRGKRALYDQQPVEAAATVSACLTAAQVTGDITWIAEARRALRWFLGENTLGLEMADVATGGCSDGLHDNRVSENQGAESTLSYLTALADLHRVSRALSAVTAAESVYEIH